MLEKLEKLTGYPLDDFQRRALHVVESGDDLFTTAPTSSGKTCVALVAIVKAFEAGKRVILTTPIKALSNQKYMEFSEWLTRMGAPGRITLLTGDIQARATVAGGDGGSELLIMTSEILTNKLDRSRRLENGMIDEDLVNVGLVVMDEVHYINDGDRGHVWERALMGLNTDIQMVALSATLSEPAKFCEWLSRRRKCVLVQRHDRHVPLHIGGFVGVKFVELFNTHGEKKFASETFKQLKPFVGNTTQSVQTLVNRLDADDKLPAIVFFMSRNRCVEAAKCLSRNLLCGTVPKKGKDQDEYEFAYIQEEHSYKVQCIRNRQDELFRKYLIPYRDVLEKLPGFHEFRSLLDKGIGYHHAGMLPILREYVEILFAAKLLKVVFATETLAVGINMPARSVVFTQLSKPDGSGSGLLKPDQFWQMAGRSGRRGMDERGYVVYWPIGGGGEVASEIEVRNILFSKMPSAKSTLKIDALFVLKHLGYVDAMDATLLQFEYRAKAKWFKDALDALPALADGVLERVVKADELVDRLNPRGFIKLTNQQRKKVEKELADLGVTDAMRKDVSLWKDYKNQYDVYENALLDAWDEQRLILKDNGYISNGEGWGDELTLAGKVSVGLSDGEPLIRGKMLTDGSLDCVGFEVIVAWLACFTEPIRLTAPVGKDVTAVTELEGVFRHIEELGPSRVHYDTGYLMYMWATNKDLYEICGYIDSANIGQFVKAVLRVISYIDELRTVLLGLQLYELYNKLDNPHERLFCGVVTNASLYVVH
jgi:superfamily II RNA helicase